MTAGVGYMAGPVIGGFIYLHLGFTAPFIFAAASHLVTVFLVLKFVPDWQKKNNVS